jgi:sugar O-acyltransferase (sialic acid O-acetyltransferase NeuD family)
MGSSNLDCKKQKLSPLIIFGAGGHAVSIANVALSAGYKIKGFIDKDAKLKMLLGYRILSSLNELSNIERFSFAIALGDNSLREIMHKELIATQPNLRFPPIIHASATVSYFTDIGEGSIVMPSAVIGPNSNVGRFCLLNTRSSIDHDCIMRDYSSLAPAAATGGNVSIGLRSAISIGAIIKHGVTIGNDSIVGANSYLHKDLQNNLVAYGSPVRQIRIHNSGDPYLK